MRAASDGSKSDALRLDPSPIIPFNRAIAVAVAELDGPEVVLAAVDRLEDKLTGYAVRPFTPHARGGGPMARDQNGMKPVPSPPMPFSPSWSNSADCLDYADIVAPIAAHPSTSSA